MSPTTAIKMGTNTDGGKCASFFSYIAELASTGTTWRILFPLVSRLEQIFSYTFRNGNIVAVRNFLNKPLMKVYQFFSLHLAADVIRTDVSFLLLTQDTSRVIIFTNNTSRARGADIFLLITIYFITYIWGNHGFLQPLVAVTIAVHICHISLCYGPCFHQLPSLLFILQFTSFLSLSPILFLWLQSVFCCLKYCGIYLGCSSCISYPVNLINAPKNEILFL